MLETKEAKPGYVRRADSVIHGTFARVDKFDDDQAAWTQNKLELPWTPKLADFQNAGVKPYDFIEDDTPNLITADGLQRLTNYLIGTAGLVGFTATTCRIGVGNSSTAATTADLDLGAAAGSTNRQFYIVDSAPTRTTTTVTNDTIQCVATFLTADANFAWNEWCINFGTATVANGTTVDASGGHCFFNHKIASLGTKASGSWARFKGLFSSN